MVELKLYDKHRGEDRLDDDLEIQQGVRSRKARDRHQSPTRNNTRARRLQKVNSQINQLETEESLEGDTTHNHRDKVHRHSKYSTAIHQFDKMAKS